MLTESSNHITERGNPVRAVAAVMVGLVLLACCLLALRFADQVRTIDYDATAELAATDRLADLRNALNDLESNLPFEEQEKLNRQLNSLEQAIVHLQARGIHQQRAPRQAAATGWTIVAVIALAAGVASTSVGRRLLRNSPAPSPAP